VFFHEKENRAVLLGEFYFQNTNSFMETKVEKEVKVEVLDDITVKKAEEKEEEEKEKRANEDGKQEECSKPCILLSTTNSGRFIGGGSGHGGRGSDGFPTNTLYTIYGNPANGNKRKHGVGSEEERQTARKKPTITSVSIHNDLTMCNCEDCAYSFVDAGPYEQLMRDAKIVRRTEISKMCGTARLVLKLQGLTWLKSLESSRRRQLIHSVRAYIAYLRTLYEIPTSLDLGFFLVLNNCEE
jgi:hypothetical protein